MTDDVHLDDPTEFPTPFDESVEVPDTETHADEDELIEPPADTP